MAQMYPPFLFYNQNDRGRKRGTLCSYTQQRRRSRPFRDLKTQGRKRSRRIFSPQKNERKEMRSAYHSAVYSNNDAATFSGPVSFADAIKSRSHLITTQGEVKTDGTRTLIIIERPTFISFFLFFSSSPPRRSMRTTRTFWWLRHFIYTTLDSAPQWSVPFNCHSDDPGPHCIDTHIIKIKKSPEPNLPI